MMISGIEVINLRIYDLYMPKLFYLYEGGLKSLNNGNKFTNMYHCSSCGHSFKSLWEGVGNYYGVRPNDQIIYCPKCGSRFTEVTQKNDFSFMADGEYSPLSMRICLEEYKDSLRLTLSGKEIVCDEDSEYMFHHRLYKETISFNVAQRTAIYKRYINHKLIINYNLCNIFDTSFGRDTNLKFLNHRHITSIYAGDFKKILKLLRERLSKKLESKLKFKIKSMYVCHGNKGSYFIKPILNIAYRLAFTDLNNLSVIDYNYIYRKYPFYYGSADRNFYDLDDAYLSDERLKIISKAKDTISGLLEIANLPNKPAIRRLVKDKPFLLLRHKQIYTIAQGNIDTFNNINNCLEFDFLWRRDIRTLLNQLALISYNWGIEYINALMRWWHNSQDKISCEDAIYMIFKLKDKATLWQEKPAPANLHDYLVTAIYKQEHPFRAFNINDPICRRLAMQFDSIKFYLPENSDVLRNIGKIFRNCVGNYVDAVYTGKSNIVLMSDDKGKLKACIEVQNNKLIQAKLFANKPAHNNKQINDEIIKWADKANINYDNCSDIFKPEKQILPQREAV